MVLMRLPNSYPVKRLSESRLADSICWSTKCLAVGDHQALLCIGHIRSTFERIEKSLLCTATGQCCDVLKGGCLPSSLCLSQVKTVSHWDAVNGNIQ
jgi:hypothetical protein